MCKLFRIFAKRKKNEEIPFAVDDTNRQQKV
jgi:hypothetical protein